MKASILLIALALTACATSKTKLTEGGKEVQMLENRPGQECAVVGKVIGENAQGSRDLARNHARNLAAKMDANALFIDEEVPNGAKVRIFATAYQCE